MGNPTSFQEKVVNITKFKDGNAARISRNLSIFFTKIKYKCMNRQRISAKGNCSKKNKKKSPNEHIGTL